jgi:hypothetical protein
VQARFSRKMVVDSKRLDTEEIIAVRDTSREAARLDFYFLSANAPKVKD